MSADNGIYILHTKDTFKMLSDGIYENMFNKPIDAYRVAHSQSIDTFERYKTNEPYNIGAYMVDVWGSCKSFYSIVEAMDYARSLEDDIGRTEYGIVTIDATDMNFYM